MNILIVDDSKVNLKIYAGLVSKHGFGVAQCFSNSNTALEWAHAEDVALAIIDYNMPSPNGLEFISIFRSYPDKQQTPILMVTAEHRKEVRYAALEAGANDFLTKPLDPVEFCARVKNMLLLSESQKQLAETASWLAEQVKAATGEIASREREAILRLSATAERRDPDTGGHLLRMAHYCVCIAKHTGFTETEQELILTAAPLHDIGKVAVPDSILQKRGKLTVAEFQIIKSHTIVGHEILKGSSSRLLQLADTIALTHHEKYDGSGYPQGLRAEAIPLLGRICAISDVFDALCSTRPYKEAWPIEKAVAEINRASGAHFDPRLVRIFTAVLPELTAAKARFPETPSGQPVTAAKKRSNGKLVSARAATAAR